MDLTTGGDLTDSAANFAGALVLDVGGDVVLDHPGNNFASAAGTADNITIVDVGNLDLAGIHVLDALSLTGGSLTDSAPNTGINLLLNVAGSAVLDSANDFDNVSGNAGSLSLTDVDNLNLAGLDVGGSLALTAGSLSDSAPNSAGGLVLAVSGPTVLDEANDFGTLAGRTGSLILNDRNNLDILKLQSGDTKVTAGGLLTVDELDARGRKVELDARRGIPAGRNNRTTVSVSEHGIATVTGGGKPNILASSIDLTSGGDIGSRTTPLNISGKVKASGSDVNLFGKDMLDVTINARGNTGLTVLNPQGRIVGSVATRFLEMNSANIARVGNLIITGVDGVDIVLNKLVPTDKETIIADFMTAGGLSADDIIAMAAFGSGGLIFVDGQFIGGDPRYFNRLAAVESFPAETPELKSRQGVFGDAGFVHGDLDINEPVALGLLDNVLGAKYSIFDESGRVSDRDVLNGGLSPRWSVEFGQRGGSSAAGTTGGN
jgi:hypothetical protein